MVLKPQRQTRFQGEYVTFLEPQPYTRCQADYITVPAPQPQTRFQADYIMVLKPQPQTQFQAEYIHDAATAAAPNLQPQTSNLQSHAPNPRAQSFIAKRDFRWSIATPKAQSLNSKPDCRGGCITQLERRAPTHKPKASTPHAISGGVHNADRAASASPKPRSLNPKHDFRGSA